MRTVAASLLFAAAMAGGAHGQDIDCTDWRSAPTPETGTQLGMNICSEKEWTETDRDMEAAWRLARSRAKAIDGAIAKRDPDAPKVWRSLLDGQRAWLAYRDDFCAARRNLVAGGSVAPLVYNTCRTRLTRLRTDELVEFARGMR